MDPTIFEILLGRHPYGMTPEKETLSAWVFLLLGFFLGLIFMCLMAEIGL
jgi:hypothetical protein